MTIAFTLCLLLLGVVMGEETPAPDESSRPEVVKIGEHRYRLAGIEFDAATREVFIPVTVNMREGGPIEYILVHENGKVHESIFVTAESPYNLQVVMKLLKYKSGKGDVFNSMYPPEILEKEGGTISERGTAVEFTFRAAGNDSDAPVTAMIFDAKANASMTPGAWIFTGSKVQDGAFLAQGEGSILAVYLDEISLFNMTREGADNDERWGAYTDNIPKIGTRGTLVLHPAGETVTKPAP